MLQVYTTNLQLHIPIKTLAQHFLRSMYELQSPPIPRHPTTTLLSQFQNNISSINGNLDQLLTYRNLAIPRFFS